MGALTISAQMGAVSRANGQASSDPQRTDPVIAREVVFLLMRNLVFLDLAGPADVFRNASNRVPGSYRLRFVAPEPSPALAGGLIFAGCEPLPDRLKPGTVLVVMGSADAGIDPRDPTTRKIIDWLRGITDDTLLMCVCAGCVLAAHAGLLAGRECTTHHLFIEELRRVEPRAQVLENRIFVKDGHVFTSAGVTAGLDLALHVIGEQLNVRIAADIARDLVVYMRRAGSDPALSPWVMFRNHLHPAVHRVQDAITRDPTARWSLTDLSSVACTSPRNLSRLFAEHAGCSPLEYVHLIRFALAKELVVQTRLDLERVAKRAGFSSAQHLRRVWMRREKQPPSTFRDALKSGVVEI
ncbi:MAG TPA: helix-turn-helix domain-containing protein [Steroidobacteraceae bacterium]|jgi:transcriptional regulator GlxA family with amidase domain|nr:helix-turn-helix domain-containing protein [Steroidobacteraceae bacterium]